MKLYNQIDWDSIKLLEEIMKIKQWEKWDKWDTLVFEDLTEEQKSQLKWRDWLPWPMWPAWIFEDLTEKQIEKLKWKQWEPGIQWEPWKDSIVPWPQWPSSYEIAKKNWFIGSEKQWLKSLKWMDWLPGLKWDDWKDGKDWLSAYELAKKGWFKWDLDFWLRSLKWKDWKDWKTTIVTKSWLEKHKHSYKDITWLQEYVEDTISTTIVAWTNITTSYDDNTWELTINSIWWGGWWAVESVNWQTWVVVLDANDIWLWNVDNTSDVNKPISSATQTALDGKVDENAPITWATKTKVTYDAKGLVTGGADATTADIAPSTNRNYVTDAEQTVIGNTSGTNTGDQDLSWYQLLSQKGANNWYAELDGTGKVPSGQLPAYVDDVVVVANFATLPWTGETGKIYVTEDTNITYRRNGSWYTEISASLALWETSSTAYRWDRGKTAYDHSQLTSWNPHNVTKTDVWLSNVDNTTDLNKPISTATQTALDAKVTWPASATDNAIARYDLTTGKLIQNSGATLSDAVVLDLSANDASININTNSASTQAVKIATSKFGIESNFDIAWGYSAYFHSDWTATASPSNWVVRIRQATTGASGKALIIDNLWTNLSVDIQQSGTTVASVSSAWVLSVPSIELWHATDTTLTRVSAWVIAVEGQTIATLSDIPWTPTMQQVFDAWQTITSAIWDNQTLTITQNDTTNNPRWMYITNVGTGDGLRIDQTWAWSAMRIDNSSTQRSILINQNSNYAAARETILLYSDTALTTGNAMQYIYIDNASSTIPAFRIRNDGSGALYVWVNNSWAVISAINNDWSIELWHASDTTLSRSAAWVIAVEWVVVPTVSSTNTLTNKRVTPRVTSETSSATPTINTDNSDIHRITALTGAITSMTTNLTWTPTHWQKLMIEITGTAARAITWWASFEASTVALPTTTVSTAMLSVWFSWNSATSKRRCIAVA